MSIPLTLASMASKEAGLTGIVVSPLCDHKQQAGYTVKSASSSCQKNLSDICCAAYQSCNAFFKLRQV